MKRPEVVLENCEAVYDYYQDREPNENVAKFLHGVFGKIYRPDVTYDFGAPTVIEDHFADDKKVLMVANHITAADQFVLASIAKREECLNPLIAQTYIPGKAPIFRVPPIRPFLDNFVALPTFRKKDVANSDLPIEVRTDLQQTATDRLLGICIDKANQDYNIAIFPQGTRDKAARVRSGIGKIATSIERPNNFLILPVGISYDGSRIDLRPAVHIGTPFSLAPSPDQVTEDVTRELLRCTAVTDARVAA